MTMIGIRNIAWAAAVAALCAAAPQAHAPNRTSGSRRRRCGQLVAPVGTRAFIEGHAHRDAELQSAWPARRDSLRLFGPQATCQRPGQADHDALPECESRGGRYAARHLGSTRTTRARSGR